MLQDENEKSLESISFHIENVYKELAYLTKLVVRDNTSHKDKEEALKKKELFKRAANEWHEKYQKALEKSAGFKSAYEDVEIRFIRVSERETQPVDIMDISWILEPIRKLFRDNEI